MKSKPSQIMVFRVARLFALTSIILIVYGCGLVPQKYSPPRPDPTSADVISLAEPVPTELVTASKIAFDGGLKFFIWRDGEGPVVVPANGDQWIKIHFAVSHGAKPSPFTALLRMSARVSGTDSSSTIVTSVGSQGEVTPKVYISSRQFKGGGTAEVYFVPYGSTGDQRYIVPVSNIIKLQVAFQ